MGGAGYHTGHPTGPRDAFGAQINMDMGGRGALADITGESRTGEPLHGGPGYLQLIGSRRLSTELGDLMERVNASGTYGFLAGSGTWSGAVTGGVIGSIPRRSCRT